MINHNGSYLTSVTIGVPALILLGIIGLGIITVTFFKASDTFEFWAITGLTLVILLGAGTGAAFGYYPYKGDYHRLQPISGTVKAIDSRYLAASEYLVISYDTGLTVRCDDSRCATVKVGDNLTLLCTKDHQFGSPLATDGWVCRWDQ